MKSKEIKREIAELESQRDQLNQKIYQKYSELFEAITNESPIKKGDKVVVSGFGKPETGIMGGFTRKYGEIRPIVYKIKKDGTESVFEIYTYGATIEKADQ